MKIKAEVIKYMIRFGMVAVLAIPILMWSQGPEAVKIVAYKTCLVSGGIGLAELIWATWFKPAIGKMDITNAPQSIYFFRGLLYGAIILAFTLGL